MRKKGAARLGVVTGKSEKGKGKEGRKREVSEKDTDQGTGVASKAVICRLLLYFVFVQLRELKGRKITRGGRGIFLVFSSRRGSTLHALDRHWQEAVCEDSHLAGAFSSLFHLTH